MGSLSVCRELGTIRSKKGELVGRMVLGVIPSALPMVSLLTRAMEREHPRVEFTVLSQSSEEILRNLHEHVIDAGITYLDNEPLGRMRAVPLYLEQYRLLTSADSPLGDRDRVVTNGPDPRTNPIPKA